MVTHHGARQREKDQTAVTTTPRTPTPILVHHLSTDRRILYVTFARWPISTALRFRAPDPWTPEAVEDALAALAALPPASWPGRAWRARLRLTERRSIYLAAELRHSVRWPAIRRVPRGLALVLGRASVTAALR